MASRTAAEPLRAVIIMTGVCMWVGCLRSASSTCRPVMPGMSMSRSNRAGLIRFSAQSASTPDVAH